MYIVLIFQAIVFDKYKSKNAEAFTITSYLKKQVLK